MQYLNDLKDSSIFPVKADVFMEVTDLLVIGFINIDGKFANLLPRNSAYALYSNTDSRQKHDNILPKLYINPVKKLGVNNSAIFFFIVTNIYIQ